MLHVVEQNRRVGHDDPFGAGVADVALVPECNVLGRSLSVAAQYAGEAGDPLARNRVALVRHRAGAFLRTGAERLLNLTNLGALKVADLGCKPFKAGTGQRDRLQQLSEAVARDDLG
ncbi:unannotated protein [freshwater metagenome]|uniref:Unannotated protein n=1 Tax=freshwater metagenome TaxID=449393 RepID=A0A6J7RVJ4_9ZZZZ